MFGEHSDRTMVSDLFLKCTLFCACALVFFYDLVTIVLAIVIVATGPLCDLSVSAATSLWLFGSRLFVFFSIAPILVLYLVAVLLCKASFAATFDRIIMVCVWSWAGLTAVATVAHIIGVFVSGEGMQECDVLYQNVNRYGRGMAFTLEGQHWRAMMIADVVALLALAVLAGVLLFLSVKAKIIAASDARASRQAKENERRSQQAADKAADEKRATQLEDDSGGFKAIFGVPEAGLSRDELRCLVAKKFCLDVVRELECPPFKWTRTDVAFVRGYWFSATGHAFVTGVRVPDDDVFDGLVAMRRCEAQSAQVVRFVVPPVDGHPVPPYTTLFIGCEPGVDFMEATCAIAKGDFIGVFGSRGDRNCIGGDSEGFQTSLGTLDRLSVAYNLYAGESRMRADAAEHRMFTGGGAPGRIELRYCTAQG